MFNDVRRIVSEIQYDNAPLHMLGQGDFKMLKLRFKHDPVLGHEVCYEALRRLSNNKRSSSQALRSAARRKWRQLRAGFAAEIIANNLPMPEYKPVVRLMPRSVSLIARAETETGRRYGCIVDRDQQYCEDYAKHLANLMNKKHGATR